MITSSYPVLMSRDVATTREYYEQVLGFAATFVSEWYVSLAREGHELAILHPDHETIPEAFRGRPAEGVLVNLEVDDVDAFHAALPDHPSVDVVLPLRTEDFGQRHFILAAPDGVLVDVITPIPPSGEYVHQHVG
ncbi:VOC family protein [Ornithinimicrobium murale]|uniref:VOC family protein n=1 Tax=Ornithinimicrobium murale TaxID=1050153 RepID=UPI001EDF8D23|nr:VOC family protein [Ornithinimicrobium murale]